jgi:amino acid efflux transporter
MSVGFGRAGRDITVLLAVTLTVGTMNVYIGSAAKLIAALAATRTLPGWLAEPTGRSGLRRPLLAMAFTVTCILVAAQGGLTNTSTLVRGTSACFVAVYVLALGSGVRILTGATRVAAALALALVCAVAVFSGTYLALPAAAAIASVGLGRIAERRSAHRTAHCESGYESS